ncbi:copper chaperone PCu(A)C [Ferrovibrio sp.]|jgi:copper(I)-binding protein|uniref:copper chaperone PCu(A)C n=1 Tax=Ferrovibrio sp. TaxID=1917215 RepID=UPI003D147F8A
MSRIGNGIAALAGLALLVLCSDVALAHQDEIGTLVIQHAYAEPARQGGDTLLRLAIENNGASVRQFTGLHSEVAEVSRIEVKVGSGRYVPIESMAIAPGEILDLEDTARIRLLRLRQDLVIGDSLEACLDFADGREKRVQVTVGKFELGD